MGKGEGLPCSFFKKIKNRIHIFKSIFSTLLFIYKIFYLSLVTFINRFNVALSFDNMKNLDIDIFL